MLYSHVLSVEFVVVFTVILCLLCLKRFLRKSTFFALVKAALLAIGLSLWYFIPFLDYSLHFNMKVFASGNPIQIFGLYPMQLFGIFPWRGWSSYMYMSGMQYVRAYGMGSSLVVIFFCFLYFRIQGVGGKRLKEFKGYHKVRIAALLGVLSMFMSLCIFPWDAISELSEGIRKVIYSIQFPYRFLVLVTISLTFLGCGLFAMLRQEGDGKIGTRFAIAVLIFTLFGSSFYLNHEIQGRGWSDFRETAAMGPYNMIGNGEYLSVGTEISELPYTKAVPGESVDLQNYRKKNAHAAFWCENKGLAESYVECNLLYYPGYQAVCGETKEKLSVVSGKNNVLRIKIPAGFKGSVEVDFVEKSYWRIGNMVSAVLWLMLLCFGIMSRYGKALRPCFRKSIRGV